MIIIAVRERDYFLFLLVDGEEGVVERCLNREKEEVNLRASIGKQKDSENG